MQPQLDPSTGDYTGARTADAGNAIWLRLRTPLGSWWADPTLGSRLHELAREKDLSRARQRAEQYARDALQPLIDDGRLTALDVSAVHMIGGLFLNIDAVDALGLPLAYSLFRVI